MSLARGELWHEWKLAAKNLVFPIFCQECRRRLLTDENGYFCATCWELMPRIERPFCTVCGRPHRAAVGLGTRSNFPCGRCLAGGPDRPVRRTYGVARYEGVMEAAVKLLKFHGKQRLARPLGELMVAFAGEELECDRYDMLVPVPLHAVRERERGFNQSRLLASEVAPAFPRAEVAHALRRIRPTRVQSTLHDPRERHKNIAGAFALNEKAPPPRGHVLLIDDVVTTGFTVAENATILLKGGADSVDVFAPALAVLRAGPAER
ncbi:MAG TPA: ComF family protein [Candidatus Hydrogenedentes bacterium]|nr:ComF family protein [Candidatus Hydrogenedentota bacterium]HQH53495.1 ComF family protein [Candidatus Hydrogenedentota bacterium]HQM47842.1 ComF family protein [Candidatus Hydrogenedentota bacterium]